MFRESLAVLTAVACAFVAAVPASAATYAIDPAHSTIGFSIRHLVTKVHGTFDKFTGTVDYVPGQPASWKTQVEIDPASIDTRVAMRDNHLKSPDFFDVQKCPSMAFKSGKLEMTGKDEGTLTGELTMHCVTKPVTLALTIGGLMKDPGGKEHLGASATGKLDRRDWGLTWNKAVEAGGMMVGDEVALEIDVEALPSQEAAPSPRKAMKRGEKAAREAGETKKSGTK